MAKLTRFVPKASPAARSGTSNKAIELMPIPNSGIEVAVASITTPTNDLPNPVFSAIMSADRVRNLALIKTTNAAAISCSHRKVNVIFVVSKQQYSDTRNKI